MFVVYFVSITTIGGVLTDWTNDGLFGDGWHLFGIGTSEYEDACADYAKQNIWTQSVISELQNAADAGAIGAEDILGAAASGDYAGFEDAYGSYGASVAEAGFDISDLVVFFFRQSLIIVPMYR